MASGSACLSIPYADNVKSVGRDLETQGHPSFYRNPAVVAVIRRWCFMNYFMLQRHGAGPEMCWLSGQNFILSAKLGVNTSRQEVALCPAENAQQVKSTHKMTCGSKKHAFYVQELL